VMLGAAIRRGFPWYVRVALFAVGVCVMLADLVQFSPESGVVGHV